MGKIGKHQFVLVGFFLVKQNTQIRKSCGKNKNCNFIIQPFTNLKPARLYAQTCVFLPFFVLNEKHT